MTIISSSRRRHHSLLLLLRHHHRSLSTTTTTTTTTTTGPTAPPSISVAVAKSRLRREFDPDKAVTILSSVSSPATTSPTSSRYALDLTVRRLARSRRFADIETLIESRKQPPFSSQEPFLATLILSYGAARMLDRALRLFDEIPLLCSAPHSTVSFNALLSACLRAKQPRRVPALFADLPAKHSITPDAVSYGILIKSHCLSGKISAAFDALKEMESKNIPPTTVVYTTILDSLYKEGKPDEAETLWSEMQAKGCVPDLTAYNVRAMYRALHGTPDEVLATIAEIESAGLKPDTITFNYLITSYCKNDRMEEAKGLYKGLGDKGCPPNAATFKNFLFSLCENGDFDTGVDVFNDSVRCNKIPDFRTTSMLVEGLVKGSKEEEAKAVIAEVKKRFPKNLLGGWKNLEKKLGLVVDAEDSAQLEAA